MDSLSSHNTSKNLIIDEAIQQLQYAGYRGLSMGKLAQKLNISQPDIGKYYKNEHDILKEIVLRETELGKLQFMQVQQKATHDLQTFAMGVEDATWSLIENGGFTPCTISLLLRDEKIIPEDIKSIMFSYVEWSGDFFFKQAAAAAKNKGFNTNLVLLESIGQQLFAAVREFLENVNTCIPVQDAKQKYRGTLIYNYKAIETNLK